MTPANDTVPHALHQTFAFSVLDRFAQSPEERTFLHGYFVKLYTKNGRISCGFIRDICDKCRIIPEFARVDLFKRTFNSALKHDFAHATRYVCDVLQRMPRFTYAQKKIMNADKTALKEFADQLSRAVERDISELIGRGNHHIRLLHGVAEQICAEWGVKPVYGKQDDVSEDMLIASLLRMMCIKWCYRKLVRIRDYCRECVFIAAGFVHAKAQSYVSNDCLHTYKQRMHAQAQFIESTELVNTDTAEVLNLADVFQGSLANPEIRRNELMTRLRGLEQQAEALGFVGRMYTLTCPSKYHATTKRGHFNQKWQQFSPRDAQRWLCKTWELIRASVQRKNIEWFGMRMAEPHADGTPHFHILLFMRATDVETADAVMQRYALREDAFEAGAQENRLDIVAIDPERGSATGYISKYISKNIDGFALNDDVDFEDGNSMQDNAARVTAWARQWRIRQFQPIGAAPVGVWRELRRIRYEVENKTLEKARGAADNGNFSDFIDAMGGVFATRETYRIALEKEIADEANAYGEPVEKIKGLQVKQSDATQARIQTRSDVWVLQKRGEAAPWSSGNNCTRVNPWLTKLRGFMKKGETHDGIQSTRYTDSRDIKRSGEAESIFLCRAHPVAARHYMDEMCQSRIT